MQVTTALLLFATKFQSDKHHKGLDFVKPVHGYPRLYSILFFLTIILQNVVNKFSDFNKIQRFITSFNKAH
jgi:hypothetical protein